MKNRIQIVVIIVLTLLVSNLVHSQVVKDDQKVSANDISFFATELNFISDAVYMGRKDSISAPYLYPSISYYNKSGFYATGSLSYLLKNNENRIDLSLLTIGYVFESGKLSGDISATKYFFNNSSYNVISEVEGDLTAHFIYDLDVLNVAISTMAFFNSDSSTDIIVSPELSHDFISTNQQFQFSPALGINFGSQNFYQEYYMNNRLGNRMSSGSGMGQGNGTNPTPVENITIDESESFKLMAIEFRTPVQYTHNAFTFSFIPFLVFPQNEATILADNVVIEEELDETFYWMIGLRYIF